MNKVPDDTAEFQTRNLPSGRLNFFITAFVLFVCLFVFFFLQ